jgi:hypothetical protein
VVIAKTETLRVAGGFTDLNINAEDTDLWMKIGTAPGFVHLRSPITAAYREHPISAIADTTKTRDGMLHLIRQEQEGIYPGGGERRKERLIMLTRHLRAASMQCVKAGQWKDGMNLYRASFGWNVREFRLKYLLGFPLVAMTKKPGVHP